MKWTRIYAKIAGEKTRLKAAKKEGLFLPLFLQPVCRNIPLLYLTLMR